MTRYPLSAISTSIYLAAEAIEALVSTAAAHCIAPVSGVTGPVTVVPLPRDLDNDYLMTL